MKNKGLLIFAAVALVAVVLMMKKQQPAYYPPVTGNATRDSQTSKILSAVMLAGGTIEAIQKLIAQFNNSSDSAVSSYYNNVSAGGGVPTHAPDGSPIDYSAYA